MYTTNDKNEQAWAWKCPQCGELNLWEWDIDDIPRANDVIDLVCDFCGDQSKMVCDMRLARSERVTQSGR